jgi:hypothetical protein
LWLWLFASDYLDAPTLDRLLTSGFYAMKHSLLYLDFDNPINLEELDKAIYNVAQMSGIKLERLAVHNTKRGNHVIVSAEWLDRKELTPAETVALQLLLGSDPKREALNLMRAHNLGDAPDFWRDRWNVLYSEKL